MWSGGVLWGSVCISQYTPPDTLHCDKLLWLLNEYIVLGSSSRLRDDHPTTKRDPKHYIRLLIV